MPTLKRRSRMVSFRLSEDEYSDLKHLCHSGAARSVSELARNALQELIVNGNEHRRGTNGTHPVESVVQVLQVRVEALDLEVKRLAMALGRSAANSPNGQPPARPALEVEEDANL